jgi:hypothetical protein
MLVRGVPSILLVVAPLLLLCCGDRVSSGDVAPPDAGTPTQASATQDASAPRIEAADAATRRTVTNPIVVARRTQADAGVSNPTATAPAVDAGAPDSGTHCAGPPKATSSVRTIVNLDATESAPVAPWSVLDPTLDMFVTTTVIFDSVGHGHALELHFYRTYFGAEYHAVVAGDELAEPAGSPVEVGNGSLWFSTEGLLTAVTRETPLSVSFAGAAPAQTIAFDFGAIDGDAGAAGTTAWAAPSALEVASQDGFPAGGVGCAGSVPPQQGLCLPKPKATTVYRLGMNLNAAFDSSDGGVAVWNAQDPSAGSAGHASTSIFDSIGESHALDLYFWRSSATAYGYHAIVDGFDLVSASPGVNVEVGSGVLTFGTQGELLDEIVTTPITIDFHDATAGQVIAVDFGTPVSRGGKGTDGTVMTNAPTEVFAQTTDGYSAGSPFAPTQTVACK